MMGFAAGILSRRFPINNLYILYGPVGFGLLISVDDFFSVLRVCLDCFDFLLYPEL